MKKPKNIICLTLALALSLVLAACAAPAQPTVTDTPTAPTPDVSPVLCDAEPAITAEFAIDRLLQQISDTESFTDAEGEYANNVLFTARRDIQDIRYLEISPEIKEDGSIVISGEMELYRLDKLTEAQPLLISVSFNGSVPDRAISYVDDCGGTHYFCLALSGEDNVPLLIPAEK